MSTIAGAIPGRRATDRVRYPGEAGPITRYSPCLDNGHAAFIRRHVRVLRPVYDRLRYTRAGQGRATNRGCRRHVLRSGAVHRLNVLWPIYRHLRVRFRRRQIRQTDDLHLLDVGLLRRNAGHGVPKHRLRGLFVAHDRWHRHRRRTGHHRHLHRRTGAEVFARAGFCVQPDRPVYGGASCRIPVLYSSPTKPAGMGWLALGRSDWRRWRVVRMVPAPQHSRKPALAAQPGSTA